MQHWATNASISVAILNLVASILIVGLSQFEYSRSVRPSTLLSGYLLLSSVLDCAQLRTLYLLGQTNPIAHVFSASWALRLVMLVVESHDKTSCLKPQYQSLPPESKSGIINRSFLWWLNQLFSIGFKGIMSESDLFELDPNLAAENVGGTMREAWEKRSMVRQHLHPAQLLIVYRTFGKSSSSHLHCMASSLSPIRIRDPPAPMSHRFYFCTTLSYQQSAKLTGGSG